MMHFLELALTVLASVLASSGFWAFIQSRRDKKDAKTQIAKSAKGRRFNGSSKGNTALCRHQGYAAF